LPRTVMGQGVASNPRNWASQGLCADLRGKQMCGTVLCSISN
jgi:hypothetical protein